MRAGCTTCGYLKCRCGEIDEKNWKSLDEICDMLKLAISRLTLAEREKLGQALLVSLRTPVGGLTDNFFVHDPFTISEPVIQDTI
jgi:hypothetical protein